VRVETSGHRWCLWCCHRAFRKLSVLAFRLYTCKVRSPLAVQYAGGAALVVFSCARLPSVHFLNSLLRLRVGVRFVVFTSWVVVWRWVDVVGLLVQWYGLSALYWCDYVCSVNALRFYHSSGCNMPAEPGVLCHLVVVCSTAGERCRCVQKFRLVLLLHCVSCVLCL